MWIYFCCAFRSLFRTFLRNYLESLIYEKTIINIIYSLGIIHQIGAWGSFYEFVSGSITIQLGDTLQCEPFAGLIPVMFHTITSDNIPS